MDVKSLTRPAPRSTGWVLAGNHVYDQVAYLLGMEEATARRSFLGEPVEVVLAMAGWALAHEGEEGFFSETILPVWAEMRSRGVWRSEDRRVEECRHCSGLSNSSQESHSEAEYPVCRGAGVGLKPLRIRSEGRRR